MKNIINKITLAATLTASLSSCGFFTINEVVDPNAPSVSSVSQNATRAQLQNLVNGLESRHRDYMFVTTALYGTFGREVWYLNASDQRFVTNWLGQRGIRPDGQFFFTAGAYNSPYQAVRQAHITMDAADGATYLTAEEKNGFKGFANTIKGYQLLIPANGLYNNGIRLEVRELQNPGPFTANYQESLNGIKAVLDEGAQQLSNATISFGLTNGFAGFNTATGLRQVNRAIAARVAIYRKDWQGALTALNESFFDINGNLDAGPAHTFGAPPDVFNPLFYPFDRPASTLLVVHPSLIADAIPGDRRVAEKFARRTANPLTNTDGVVPLLGEYQDNRWRSNTDPVKFIRNEELILIYAEAQAQLNNSVEALRAINRIRTAAGIGEYTGPTDTASLINEILFQRRYSLWAEPAGHRWIDARRYDRLNAIPVQADQGAVFTQLERPLTEINWDNFYGG